MATDLRTGRSRHLRNDPGREPEEERVTMIRVSQGKQYFIVAFAAAPFELWDLRKLCLLRTMPKKFPPISALVWSPLHSSKGRRGSGGSREGSPALQQLEAKTGGGQKAQKQPSSQIQSGKEHILLTDTVGQVKKNSFLFWKCERYNFLLRSTISQLMQDQSEMGQKFLLRPTWALSPAYPGSPT